MAGVSGGSAMASANFFASGSTWGAPATIVESQEPVSTGKQISSSREKGTSAAQPPTVSDSASEREEPGQAQSQHFLESLP